MTKLLSSIILFASTALSALAGSNVVYNATITRPVEKTQSQPTTLQVSTNVLSDKFGMSVAAVEGAISDGSIAVIARNPSGKLSTSENTFGKGFWFTKSGIPCAANNTNRRIACKYENGQFHIVHFNDKCLEGDSYLFNELFVYKNDTIQYSFTVALGTTESVECDQPAFEFRKLRADRTDTWKVKPQVRINEQTPLSQNYVQVQAGESFTLDCVLPKEATSPRFSWKYRGTKSLASLKTTSALTIESATPENAGYYVLSGYYNDETGTRITFNNCIYYVDVQTEPLGTPFSWEGRVPQFSHDWTTDSQFKYGKWEKPEKVHTVKKKDGTPANQYVGEWWSAFWGDNLNAEVGGQAKAMEAAENMIKKYDDDFAYIRDYMGWPPDKSARDGYKSFVYIFGSGLANDNTSNTEKGGYQGNTRVDGQNYACVWASYYPFSRFRSDADQKWSDGDYQREAMIHEGIHAIFADLNACQKSAWFHEAGNTWLQSAMNTERYNKYGEPGFLDACPLVAPFMPIECYSGWLQDGSFGGPTAEGVNMYNSSGQQVCTWRNLLGGNQYGNSFPIILGEICGKGSIPWIWRNAKDYVLKSIGTYLGEETMRQLIQQYRSRMATFDIGGWKKGYRNVMNNNIGTTVKAEWSPYWIDVAPFRLTPYQGLTKNDNDFWMAPDTLTNPGWSGANIIPIHVDSKANTATVEFRPEDTEMRAQLCYVTKSGKNYYSQPVQCGKMQIDITDRPANNVIFCVVCNTDYIYTNDNNQAQRKKHWDYRIRFGEGALQVADLYTKWSLNEQTLKDANFNEDQAREERELALGIDNVNEAPSESAPAYTPGANGVRLLTGYCKAGYPITVQVANGINLSDVRVNMLGLSGIVVDDAPLAGNTYTLPSNLRPGLYFIKFIQNGKADTYKVVIK